jgi:hypothetical protein
MIIILILVLINQGKAVQDPIVGGAAGFLSGKKSGSNDYSLLFTSGDSRWQEKIIVMNTAKSKWYFSDKPGVIYIRGNLGDVSR